MNDHLIRSEKIFNDLNKEYTSILFADRLLPEFIFKKKFQKYFLMEYVNIELELFPFLLNDLANFYDDHRINYVSLMPDAVKYYMDMHGFFGMASFEPSKVIQSYFPTMNRGNRADSFLYRGGDIGFFWGSSQEWAIYCDRINWEIGLVALSESFVIKNVLKPIFLDRFELFGHISAQYGSDNAKTIDFIKNLFENYTELSTE